MMDIECFQKLFAELTHFRENRFHPLVWINGEPDIGKNVYIGGMSEINANGALVSIGDNCDIASFVSINCADSHKKSIGLVEEIERRDITIEESVFIGSHCVIKGGAYIGHHSVVAAGTIVEGVTIPPYSLVIGNPMQVKERYYLRQRVRNIPHNKPTTGSEEEQAVIRVIRSGYLSQGQEVEALEKEFCEFVGLPQGHAVAVSSGTAALFLALTALDAKGKGVAFPAYVCSSLRNAVAMVGANEVLVDNAPGSPNINIEALKRCESRVAIVPHMFGIPVDVSNLSGIEIIEDCAQALGAKVRGTYVGLQGKIGVFSFYATKLLTSGGQGGMVVSSDNSLVNIMRDYREFDQRKDNKARFNFQMTDLQAAVGRVQLHKIPLFLERREDIFTRYQAEGLDLLDVLEEDKDTIKPVRYRAVLKTGQPERLIASLEKKGIKAIVPIEDWELLGRPELFPEALRLTKQTLSLPIYPSLSNDDIASIIEGVKGG